jgi:hypothetical protein
MTTIPLARAYVCLDCEIVVQPSEWQICPLCAGRYLFPIARWLNREPAAEAR